jgi:guanine deaminase
MCLEANVKELKSPSCWDTVPLWPEFSLATKDGAMNDADFMRMAIQAAREGMGKGEMPFGACIVHKGKVLAVAHNSAKADIDTTAHGEVQAIRAASRQLRQLNLHGATIYTTCEPCPMCFAACLWANLGRIVYACRIEDAAKAGIRQIPIPTTRMKQLSQSDVLITGDVLREDSLKLFDAWLRLPR